MFLLTYLFFSHYMFSFRAKTQECVQLKMWLRGTSEGIQAGLVTQVLWAARNWFISVLDCYKQYVVGLCINFVEVDLSQSTLFEVSERVGCSDLDEIRAPSVSCTVRHKKGTLGPLL